MGLHHRNMRTEQGWLKKVHNGVPEPSTKNESCWPPKGLAWSLGSQKEEVDTKPFWRWVYKDFPAPYFFGAALGEDNIQLPVPGLSVGQEAAWLGPGIRRLQVVPCNTKAMFVLVGQLLYTLRCSSGSPLQGWGALLPESWLADASEERRLQSSPCKSSIHSTPNCAKWEVVPWSYKVRHQGDAQSTILRQKQPYGNHGRCLWTCFLWPEGGLETPQLL